MSSSFVRTRVDKEGNAIFGSPPATERATPDLAVPANCRRAAAVLRDVATHLARQHPAIHVDPLHVVWTIGRARTAWSVDCALAALRDHQHHHDPGWTSWPEQVPAHDLADTCLTTAGELDDTTRNAPWTTKRKARR